MGRQLLDVEETILDLKGLAICMLCKSDQQQPTEEAGEIALGSILGACLPAILWCSIRLTATIEVDSCR